MQKSPADRILMLLKMRREATAALIASELAITKEGARKHLLNLANQNLIVSNARSEGIGRPSTYYSLSPQGMARFPDSHADITVQLLQSIKQVLGENALDLLISDRESKVYQKYTDAISDIESIEKKLEVIAAKRTEEGYMAEWRKEADDYLLIENHCPICAAATECQGFCRSELNNFQQLIGPAYRISRIEYIIENAPRCTYRISKAK
ncbi:MULTISPECIES: helix-turn-helix transcriptional regulator [Sphingobacterium]|uniref:MarR family transcriptional regulator n=2 Tax=Sphingobacteriaceae TaxID=84566 RepID=A0A654D7R0_SPHMU|nr:MULTISPECIES: metalloregulator ArsR/SmtB family transcription factor [Sphingobacterium]HBI87272.1 MarR family transcriptional regulator [Sphingobacterium sp.]QQT45091.1 transcriptional regulator [Sphingobacterium multivorum]QQT62254.1 transcriptional regulator [Sphingobacterium multivorum]SUJ20434.1 iron-sulfur cluster biosynthesis transcriptional regulator SufR [Sphingobacterium multivorum]VXD00596.1 MarR family transcriptional regulator [Sphingobacterium multivorum]